MKIKFSQLKIGFVLTMLFLFFTVAGTLLHEGGHWLASRMLGVPAEINYKSSSSNWDAFTPYREFMKLHEKNYEAIRSKKDFADKETYEKLRAEVSDAVNFTVWGGPIQTLLTGCLGVFILLILKIKRAPFSWKYWASIFLALFWLRPAMNLLMSLPKLILRGEFTEQSDEVRLARYHELHPLFISVVFGLIGLAVLTYISFYVVPRNRLLVFWASGLMGGILGFYLWFYQLGPILMP
ncbi:MAG: hypothetical protein L6Q78_05005 [Bacteroidia bacterium]|nr:hypothetical protein [Bacteroidia bacterium]